MTLSADEIELVWRALDALEAKDGLEFAMTSLLNAAAAATPAEATAAIEKEKTKYDAGLVARRQRSEQVIMLKAKLIRMRDGMEP